MHGVIYGVIGTARGAGTHAEPASRTEAGREGEVGPATGGAGKGARRDDPLSRSGRVSLDVGVDVRA